MKGFIPVKNLFLVQKARKPQAAKNGPKKAHPCDKCDVSFVYPFQEEEDEIIIQHFNIKMERSLI